MIKLAHREDCCGCAACAAACPHGAIRMEADGMGFRYPAVDASLCVDCGLCEEVCAFKPITAEKSPRAEAIRFPSLLEGSQSGGLAAALMRKAIGEGYVVYGAALDSDLAVRHRRVATQEGLEPLRLSKYVQSDMDGIPGQVLQDLESGKKVLFTGTPCQCAGIGSLCGAHRENLLLADILCHGVPAPAVWKGYLDDSAARKGTAVSGALFRDPSLGWHEHKERLCYGDGSSEVRNNYTFLFYRHLMLRPSCNRCPFASLNRPSDITMADCWGVEKALPGFADDNRGCSLLLVNTPDGEGFTAAFPDACERRPIDVQKVLQRNMLRPTKANRYAKSFENDYIRKGFAFVDGHYGRESLNYRIEKWIWSVKKRFRR
ncbi:MAG: Coenzyme F420 hydrogenase/dehydrogenase, beta subunit C-terminal domain [Bacteroidales bacterium]|nr:Coenzyme F420 hydrogenase/dehydrogenase, beta subunit C-terminal domain [Bacteroidales bacterium]